MKKYYKTIAVSYLVLVLMYQGGLRVDDAVADDTAGDAAKTQQVNYFDVMEYRVEGNTRLKRGKIEETVYPFLGEKKSIDDVEKARAALEKTYHDAGYLTVLVDIPEQDVNKGVVILNVTEGKVGKLSVKGAKYYSLGRIKAQAVSLTEGEVPYFPQVQKDVGSLNRTADMRVTPVMRPGKVFGTVDVDLKVEDNLPLHGSLELNDQYSQNTTHLRLAGALRYDNLWQHGHSLGLQFQTSPENMNQVKVLSANYLWRFDDSDTMLAFYGIKSDSNVSTVGGINVIGKGTILGARVILPLPSLDNYFHSVSLGGDYKHFGQSILFGGTLETPVTYAPLSATYNGTEQDTSGQTQFISSLSFNVRGFVAKEQDFANKRAGATPDFFILKADAQRTQKLPWDLQGFVHVDGQFAGQPLISNEQYLAGGANSVRGYLESELPGDRALHATLELRSPRLFSSIEKVQDLRALVFYDAAKVWWLDDSATHPFIAGTGFGVRLKAYKNFNADLAFAVPLHKGEVTSRGDARTHMRVWYEF